MLFFYAIYCYRPTPIWENTSKLVYEMEWALSRNGNYLRKNSKPLFVVFADEDDDNAGRGILQYPQGSQATYVTWQQAVENLKFYINELRNSFFTQLQLPDWSYEKMSQQAMSGESRKQLFIDSQLKVKDESGRLLEMFDRETNVLKAFLKTMAPAGYEADIDELPVETLITPFSITDEKNTISNRGRSAEPVDAR
ncbi:MAG: phage portal protein [Bacteroidales bacterium]|nr:phage portal protein [Bacteroidales bacterium]